MTGATRHTGEAASKLIMPTQGQASHCDACESCSEGRQLEVVLSGSKGALLVVGDKQIKDSPLPRFSQLWRVSIFTAAAGLRFASMDPVKGTAGNLCGPFTCFSAARVDCAMLFQEGIISDLAALSFVKHQSWQVKITHVGSSSSTVLFVQHMLTFL